MKQEIVVPSPQEVLATSQVAMSKNTQLLLTALVALLREKFVGDTLTIKLKDIKRKASVRVTENDDWNKMEFELKKQGWSIVYNGPAWDENFDSYYRIGAKK